MRQLLFILIFITLLGCGSGTPSGDSGEASSPFAAATGVNRAIVQVHGVGPFHIHWVNGVATLDSPAASGFLFRKTERVEGRRGKGVIRQGYASGDIIQYEIAGDDGTVFMENQSDIRRF